MPVIVQAAGPRTSRPPPDRPRPHDSDTPAPHGDPRCPRRKKVRLGCVRVLRPGLQGLIVSDLCTPRPARSSANCHRLCSLHLAKSAVERCQAAYLALLSLGQHSPLSAFPGRDDLGRHSDRPLAVEFRLRLGMDSRIPTHCPPRLQLSLLTKGHVLRVPGAPKSR